jgi:hypothetical protein
VHADTLDARCFGGILDPFKPQLKNRGATASK